MNQLSKSVLIWERIISIFITWSVGQTNLFRKSVLVTAIILAGGETTACWITKKTFLKTRGRSPIMFLKQARGRTPITFETKNLYQEMRKFHIPPFQPTFPTIPKSLRFFFDLQPSLKKSFCDGGWNNNGIFVMFPQPPAIHFHLPMKNEKKRINKRNSVLLQSRLF